MILTTILARSARVSTAWQRLGGVCLAFVAIANLASAASILVGNILPNPDMETETRFVSHRTEGPTDNSFADYWRHSDFSGWHDVTPPK